MDFFATRVTLPYTVPPGGHAILLVDGRISDPPVHGPGPLPAVQGRGEALVLPSGRLRLALEVPNLRSKEDVRLDLNVFLDLQVGDPLQFYVDLVGDAPQLGEDDLRAVLAPLVQRSLVPAVGRLSLAELNADPTLRAWLGAAIRQGLSDIDLAGRSGLTVVDVDAYDLHCKALNEAQDARAAYYFEATLAGAAAEGRRLLDERLLQELRLRLPVKEELVSLQDRMASLEEQVTVHPSTLPKAFRQQLLNPPSRLRPELWRQSLASQVLTAPLVEGDRLFVARRDGQLFAFDAADGSRQWEEPVSLPAAPGDGMAVAAGILWAPGHDGVLYGLSPEYGRVVHQITIGGRLSSAPLAHRDLLYVSVNVDSQRWSDPATGHLVCVDARRAAVVQRWPVSKYGLRAQPALLGNTLVVGDRRGQLFFVDLESSTVQKLPRRGGRVTGAACADTDRNQVYVGDSYGCILALDAEGNVRREARLGTAGGSDIVGGPTLNGDFLYAGASDGSLYTLDPESLEQVRAPFLAKGPIATRPLGWRRLLFFGANDGYLYALHSRTGELFWRFHSGHPVVVPPAVNADGNLFVVDSRGNVNALRWCLSQYAEGARRAQSATPPRWAEAIELWVLAGEANAALEAAEQAKRFDIVGELAMTLNWHEKAAAAFTQLARRYGTGRRASAYFSRAAQAWRACQDDIRAWDCRLAAAKAAEAPLLALEIVNRPQMTVGLESVLQVLVRNVTGVLARDVRLTYSGHVQHSELHPMHSIGPNSERRADIPITPTASGSAMLRLRIEYADPRGHAQEPVEFEARLSVALPPTVQHIYQGPVINGEGVIMMRGGRSRQIQIQSGQEEVVISRSAAEKMCPVCGEQTALGEFCGKCGQSLP